MKSEVGNQKSESRAPAVEATGLTRVYRRGAEIIRALKEIDLQVEQGEFVGLLGRSGAGKTTLLNLIGLMDRPTDGRLHVLGADVGKRRAGLDALRRQNIGFIFQEFYLMPTLTALENVLMPTMWGTRKKKLGAGLQDSGRQTRSARDKARELLRSVGLEHRMSHRPTELSGGEMQRVAIARALINSPRLLLADEPTGNLDTKTRDDILCLLLSLNRDSGLTVVVATHDRRLESRFTRVVRLEDGNVI